MNTETHDCKALIPKRAIISWLLYDAANSVYPTLVTTFLFAPYFVKAVATDTTTGTAQWGLAMSIAAIIAAIAAPVMGAIADSAGGRRKPSLLFFTLVCAAATSGLWFVAPDPSFVALALSLVVTSQVAFELANAFYNSMLVDIAPRGFIGRISGWGWAMGYLGGLAALVVALVVFIQAKPPPFGIDPAHGEHVRASMLFAGAWFAAFAMPLFLCKRENRSRLSIAAAIRRGTMDLAKGFSVLRKHPRIAPFLIARMVYNDGIIALFAFSGIYAAGTFAMTLREILLLGIATNVTAATGSFAFAWMDDKAGSRATISLSLLALILCGAGALLTRDKTIFSILALGIGFFVGPAQSASRSYMLRIAPWQLRTQMLGLYALSGKATVFIAPAALAWVTAAFHSQRAGMSVILAILVTGLYLLRRLDSGDREGADIATVTEKP